jgi:hypothetical protein
MSIQLLSSGRSTKKQVRGRAMELSSGQAYANQFGKTIEVVTVSGGIVRYNQSGSCSSASGAKEARTSKFKEYIEKASYKLQG